MGRQINWLNLRRLLGNQKGYGNTEAEEQSNVVPFVDANIICTKVKKPNAIAVDCNFETHKFHIIFSSRLMMTSPGISTAFHSGWRSPLLLLLPNLQLRQPTLPCRSE